MTHFLLLEKSFLSMIFFFPAFISPKIISINLNKGSSDQQKCISHDELIFCSSIFQSIKNFVSEHPIDLFYYLPDEFEFKEDFEKFKFYNIEILPRSIIIMGIATSKVNGTLFLPADVEVTFDSSVELHNLSFAPEINKDKHSLCNILNENACLFTISSLIIQDGTYNMKTFDIIYLKSFVSEFKSEELIINKNLKTIYQVEQFYIGNNFRITVNGGCFMEEISKILIYSEESIKCMDSIYFPSYSISKILDILFTLKSIGIDEITIYFETNSQKVFDIQENFSFFSDGWNGPSTIIIDTIEADTTIVGLLYYQAKEYEKHCTFIIGPNIISISAVINVSSQNPIIDIISAIPINITLEIHFLDDFKDPFIEIVTKEENSKIFNKDMLKINSDAVTRIRNVYENRVEISFIKRPKIMVNDESTISNFCLIKDSDQNLCDDIENAIIITSPIQIEKNISDINNLFIQEDYEFLENVTYQCPDDFDLNITSIANESIRISGTFFVPERMHLDLDDSKFIIENLTFLVYYDILNNLSTPIIATHNSPSITINFCEAGIENFKEFYYVKRMPLAFDNISLSNIEFGEIVTKVFQSGSYYIGTSFYQENLTAYLLFARGEKNKIILIEDYEYEKSSIYSVLLHATKFCEVQKYNLFNQIMDIYPAKYFEFKKEYAPSTGHYYISRSDSMLYSLKGTLFIYQGVQYEFMSDFAFSPLNIIYEVDPNDPSSTVVPMLSTSRNMEFKSHSLSFLTDYRKPFKIDGIIKTRRSEYKFNVACDRPYLYKVRTNPVLI